MRLIVVRHGVTDWNVQGRLQGRTDIDLNAEGALQARRLAERLASEPIERLFSSPTRRASRTAMAVASARGLPVETDEDLHEGHMGLWEGLTWEEIASRFPRELAERDRVGPSWKGHRGESIDEVSARAERFYRRLRASPPACACVVTHAALARHLLVHALGDPAQVRLRLRNTSVSIVELDPSPRAVCLDDISHLEPKEDARGPDA